MTNLCVNCKHYFRDRYGISRCTRDATISPVSGMKEEPLLFCELERRYSFSFFGTFCSKKGKFYEPNTSE